MVHIILYIVNAQRGGNRAAAAGGTGYIIHTE